MDYAKLFALYDHPTHWEYPPGFDYETANARFLKFVEALSKSLGYEVQKETGAHIQDASFHSQVLFPVQRDRQPTIRFSNFGDMASVSFGELLPKETTDIVDRLLKEHGYINVPSEELDLPYSGDNPGVTGIETWGIRYFSWV